jgi:hypothetical protein
LFCDSGRAADNLRVARVEGPSVSPEHHIRLEYSEQGAEVAIARGRQESIDNLALPTYIGVRRKVTSVSPGMTSH